MSRTPDRDKLVNGFIDSLMEVDSQAQDKLITKFCNEANRAILAGDRVEAARCKGALDAIHALNEERGRILQARNYALKDIARSLALVRLFV
jgi:hypothetical protein